MKRTRVLRLVLLGGGVVAMVAGCGDQSPTPPQNDQTLQFACEQAKQQNLPNATEICQRAATATSSTSRSGTYSSYGSGSGGWFPWFFGRSYGGSNRSSSGSSWFSGRSSSSSSGFTGSSSSSSSRGGFGTSASRAGS